MNIHRRMLIAAGAATVLIAGSGGVFAQNANKTLNIGFFPVVSPVPIMQAQKQLEEKGYTVNWVPITQGLPGAASALAAGRLDMSWGNSVSAVVIFSQSPESAQFVGQSFVNANVTVVATDSPIQSPAEIQNKKVVVSGPKTASTLFFKIALKKAGVDPEANEYFVSGTGPGMVGVLDSGGAEVVAGYVPYVSDMVLKKIGRVLFTGSDAIGRAAPGDGFIASTALIKSNPQAVQDVLAAQAAATDYIKSNPDEAYKLMAEFAKVDVEAVRYSFDNDLIGVAGSYVPDVDGIVETVTIAQELGFAPEGVDLPAYAKTFNNVELAGAAAKAR
ncbi:MAG TPA: ABC transporter substrate-binding protein [Tianweitania sediminis]|jgi:taurine transport system substrate-binding protein|nr:ABC transporter substrate-binding protein [Tianweitania sediminis]